MVESSAPERNKAERIKTHHNVGGLPVDMEFELVEPLRYVFKDEVRAVGEELGLPRILVWRQPFPGPGRKWPISRSGGAQVRWSRDGRELFYIAADKRLMSVPVTVDTANQRVDAGAPRPLFTTSVGAVAEVNRQQYMPAADGRRFLMNTVKAERTYPITVLLNWRGP